MCSTSSACATRRGRATTVLILAVRCVCPSTSPCCARCPTGWGRTAGRRTPRKMRRSSAPARGCRAKRSKDSPLFQLLDGIKPLEVAERRTDVFRDQVAYAQRRSELAQARKAGKDAVDAVRRSTGPDRRGRGRRRDRPAAVLSRGQGLGGHGRPRRRMPEPLRSTTNGPGAARLRAEPRRRGEEAERVLLELIEGRGPSSET